MGSYAGEIVELFSPGSPDEEDENESEDSIPLGTRLRGRASDIDIDPVEAVREVRERR